MKRFYYLLFLCLFPFLSWAQPAGYGYGKQITINSAQVSGTTTLANFAVLLSFTDNDLRTVTNGGHVENSNGWDIIFTLANCETVTVLNHQIEKYNATTGELVAWVRIPSLPATSDFTFHMYYGNSSVTTAPSSPNVWHSEVRAVYHLSNNDFSDGTSNGMNGTNNSTGNITGKIGDARSFSGTQYIRVVENGSTSLDVTTVTMSAWIYPTSYTTGGNSHRMIVNKEHVYEMGLQNASGRFQAASRPGCWRWLGTQIPPLNTWSRVTIVFSGGEQKNYVNGTLVNTYNDCSNPITLNDHDLKIGARGGDPSTYSFFTGNIDEVKIVGREETADWIMTEYNNQNNPSAFHTISAEYTATNLCLVLPIELVNFNVESKNNKTVDLSWATTSERNNDFFTMERSKDAQSWEVIETIDGAGNSIETIDYSTTDNSPYKGISYYRLKQTDFDGNFEYFPIRSVEIKDEKDWTLFPNPANEKINIQGSNLKSVEILNVVGSNVGGQVNILQKSLSHIELNISELPKGMYLIRCNKVTKRLVKK